LKVSVEEWKFSSQVRLFLRGIKTAAFRLISLSFYTSFWTLVALDFHLCRNLHICACSQMYMNMFCKNEIRIFLLLIIFNCCISTIVKRLFLFLNSC
jgi:hypothetical protein